MANVTEKNTKNEILAAYAEIKKKLDEAKASKATPQEFKKEQEVKEVINTAIAECDPSFSLSDDLTKFVVEISDAEKKFRKIKEAIEIKESELKSIYGIEVEANTLFALINTQEESKKLYREDFQKERDEAVEEIKMLNEQYADAKANLEKARKRENEEYSYNFSKESKYARDKLADELGTRRENIISQIKAMKSDAENEIAARLKEVEEREADVAKLEISSEEMVELKNKAVALSESVRAKSIENNSIKKEFDHKLELIETRNNAEIDRLTGTIGNYIAIIEGLKTDNKALTEKLDISYANIKEMAQKQSESVSSAATIAALKDVVKNSNNSK